MAVLAGQGYLSSILIREGELRCIRAGLEHGREVIAGRDRTRARQCGRHRARVPTSPRQTLDIPQADGPPWADPDQSRQRV